MAKILPVFFNSFGDYEEGLHRYLIVPCIWLFGLSEWSVRLVSVWLGVGVVFGAYFLGKQLYGKTGALAAAATAAVTPWQIHLSRVAVRDILLPLLFCFGMVALIRALRDVSEKPGISKSDVLLSLGSILWALSLYSYTVIRPFFACDDFGIYFYLQGDDCAILANAGGYR